MLGIEGGGQRRLHLAAIDQGLEFARSLLVIRDHFLGERLGIDIRLFRQQTIAGVNRRVREHVDHVDHVDLPGRLLSVR
jgi:hypothetical protein